MPTPHYTVTPWRDTADLLRVRAALYNPRDGLHHSQDGIAMIQAWKLRGNLPHAVESSGLLFGAAAFHAALDEQAQGSQTTKTHDSTRNSTADNFAVRATYTMALGRFVTGFADLGRHRAGTGQTMQEVARSVGLPASFVELRHEATHEDIPTLGRLQKMTTEALSWLWQSYWARLDVPSPGADRLEVDGQAVGPDTNAQRRLVAVRDGLKAFRSKRVAAIGARETKTPAVKQAIQAAAVLCVDAIEDGDVEVEELARLLVVDAMIIPTKVDAFAIEQSAKAARLIWDDVLRAIVHSVPELLHAVLSQAVEELSSMRSGDGSATNPKVLLETWVQHLCTSKQWRTIRDEVPNRVLDWALTACCLHPGPMSCKIALRLLDDTELDAAVESRWRELLDASLAEHDSSITEESTPNDHDLAMEDFDSSMGPSDVAQGWQLDCAEWRPLPIGVVAQ